MGEKALPSGKKIAPGLIRMQKDIGELKLEKNVTIEFPNGTDDLMNFKIKIAPTEGIYRGGNFIFNFQVPSSYPHDAPKVLCETQTGVVSDDEEESAGEDGHE